MANPGSQQGAGSRHPNQHHGKRGSYQGSRSTNAGGPTNDNRSYHGGKPYDRNISTSTPSYGRPSSNSRYPETTGNNSKVSDSRSLTKGYNGGPSNVGNTTEDPSLKTLRLAPMSKAAGPNPSQITVLPLGAGQDVGRSCILISIGGKTIMLDCGMHMGYQDSRRFPDFTLMMDAQTREKYLQKLREQREREDEPGSRPSSSIPDEDRYTRNGFDFASIVDCVIISHFHLDHSGALPYFTERVGYSGPIYMTYPTKSVASILLEDMRRVMANEVQGRNGGANPKNMRNDGTKDLYGMFDEEDIARCMERVQAVSLNETVKIDDIEIKGYYAGHVLGAAMFHIKVGEQSVVYTGDYNMTADRHLGSAWITKCRPDLLITESTYATTVRGSKRSREQDFLKKVHECVTNGGKVLIPVFALGRAQELCILLEGYWDRMRDLQGKVPVYFSGGLTERATEYYKLFISWTNERIMDTFVHRNMFDFKHIQVFQRQFADLDGPMVVFASPGMLHAGTSLNIFKKWCTDPKNMVILPGYCVAGTVGAKVLAGDKQIQVDQFTSLDMNMQVENLSFSAHADSQGILQLVRMCEPRCVMLVHGEHTKMKILAQRIRSECGLPCIFPANGEQAFVPTVPLETTMLPDRKVQVNIQRESVSRLFPKSATNESALTAIKTEDATSSTAAEGDVNTPAAYLGQINSVLGLVD